MVHPNVVSFSGSNPSALAAEQWVEIVSTLARLIDKFIMLLRTYGGRGLQLMMAYFVNCTDNLAKMWSILWFRIWSDWNWNTFSLAKLGWHFRNLDKKYLTFFPYKLDCNPASDLEKKFVGNWGSILLLDTIWYISFRFWFFNIKNRFLNHIGYYCK